MAFNVDDFVSKLGNVLKYAKGFIEGARMSRAEVLHELIDIIIEELGEYLDSKAQIDYGSLHHIYEPGMAGNKSGRLFSFRGRAISENTIELIGSFKHSTKTPRNSDHVFRERAEVMESGISLTINPLVEDGVLVFEDEGQLVFTRGPVFVEHPGGPDTTGGFYNAVEAFFTSYLTVGMLRDIYRKLARPIQFAKKMDDGAHFGFYPGTVAGKSWMRSGLEDVI